MYKQDGTRNREFELSDAVRSEDCLHSLMQATSEEQTGRFVRDESTCTPGMRRRQRQRQSREGATAEKASSRLASGVNHHRTSA